MVSRAARSSSTAPPSLTPTPPPHPPPPPPPPPPPRRYRLRFLNASQFRAYNLDLSSGASMTQIGTDAGLMPTPIDSEKILIGPAERAEVVVDFAESRGDRVELRSVPRDDDPAGP